LPTMIKLKFLIYSRWICPY